MHVHIQRHGIAEHNACSYFSNLLFIFEVMSNNIAQVTQNNSDTPQRTEGERNTYICGAPRVTHVVLGGNPMYNGKGTRPNIAIRHAGQVPKLLKNTHNTSPAFPQFFILLNTLTVFSSMNIRRTPYSCTACTIFIDTAHTEAARGSFTFE